MYKIIAADSYNKLALKWLKQHPSLADKYYNVIELLEINPYHNSLRLHKQKGVMSKFYSVSIDMKYRIIIDFIIEGKTIILLNIGDHRVYK